MSVTKRLAFISIISIAVLFFVAGLSVRSNKGATDGGASKALDARPSDSAVVPPFEKKTLAPEAEQLVVESTLPVTPRPTATVKPTIVATVTPTTAVTAKPVFRLTAPPKATDTPIPIPILPTDISNDSSVDLDCNDFSNHAEAQEYFEENGGSPSNNVDDLDRDHDGIACESLK
jgi:hypothetical protein